MRKIIFIVLIHSFLGLYGIYGQSFKGVFRKALAEKNMTEAEEILNAWDYEDRNDPELYPAWFNYYTVKSMEKDSLRYDPLYANKALEYISMGIDMFPTRLDMRIAKIYMLSRLKEFGKLTDEALLLIDYSKKIDCNWKGEDFRLINSAQVVMEGAVQNCQEMLFAEEDSTLFSNIRKISQQMIKQYPENEQSWMNLSTMSIVKKDYDQSLKYLAEAEKINPKNAYMLYNIAFIYKIKDDKAKAKKYFQLTVAHAGNDGEKLKAAAEEQLKQL